MHFIANPIQSNQIKSNPIFVYYKMTKRIFVESEIKYKVHDDVIKCKE